MTAITNPLVNSYKRLVPGYEAPVYIAWSAKNRSPLIRVPSARGAGTRVELRSADPACNPYLEMALCLMAGLDGIEKGMTPPPSTDSNIYHMTEEERKAAGIEMLPGSLEEAVAAFEGDALLWKLWAIMFIPNTWKLKSPNGRITAPRFPNGNWKTT